MKGIVVSVTHYRGDSRIYLQQLIELMGGSFTRNMKQFSTTHLLVAKPTGVKYEYAQKWGIKCLNHLWLEESYAKWMLQDENNERYAQLPDVSQQLNLIGQTPLDETVLKPFYADTDSE